MKPLWGLIVCILIAFVFFANSLSNLSRSYARPGYADAEFSIFILRHYTDVFFKGVPDPFTLRQLYDFKNSLFYSDHFLVQALTAVPYYLLTHNLIITYNLTVFTLMLFSLVCAYVYFLYLTRRPLPAILGAVIFTLNPLVMAHFPGFMLLITLAWIPLIFLYLQKSLDRPSSANIFFFWLFLSLQLLSSLYFSAFLTVILPVYATVSWLAKRTPVKNLVLNPGFFLGLAVFLAVTLVSLHFYLPALSASAHNRNLSETESSYSAWVSDWFTAGSKNLLYSSLKNQLRWTVPSLTSRDYVNWERSLFPGITVIVLLLITCIRPKNAKPPLLLFFLSAVLSLGPTIHISSAFSLPGLYGLFYRIDPLLHFTRVASRFGYFAYFFLATAIALSSLRFRPWLTTLAVIIILIEYWNLPEDYSPIPPETISFYSALESDPRVKVILELPIGNDFPYYYQKARAEGSDAVYLYWAALLHSKTLFNGFVSFLPPRYYKRTEILSIDFPTRAKLLKLKSAGINAIALHLDQFREPQDFAAIKNSLLLEKVPLLISSPSLAAFSLYNWSP